ncbi:site-specific integrase [Catalinimonas sp. 4WD22]|uniref:site-specific integrase n=1 Tax=Catalinimonas locisalis TaxID=3133978 RepID=UPI0031011290
MAKLNWYLDKPNSKKETRILLYYHFEGKRIKVPIGETIEPSNWDNKKQRVKEKISTEEFYEDLNKRLENIEKEVRKAHRKAKINRTVFTKDDIIKATKPIEKLDFFTEYKKFIESKKNTSKESSIKKHYTTYNSLKKFQKSTGYKITFESLNDVFFDNYITHLISHPDYLTKDDHIINIPDKKIGLANNTIESYLVRLRAFMNYATEKELTINKNYKKFKVKEDDVEIIHLDIEEIEAFEELDLSGNKKLNNVRNLFLLECYTSLRYSDIVNLKPDNINEDAILINLTTIKTNDRLKIPISPPAKKVIKEFLEGNMYPISAQKFNTYLKELAQMAELNEPIIITRNSGSKRVELLYNKYELITSHVGRKTFVTIHYLGGVRTEILMSITGHKDYRNFKRYLKIGEKDKAKAINDVWLKYKPEIV